MKKFRVLLTLAAFAVAIAGAASTTSKKLESSFGYGEAYGYNPETAQCEIGTLLQQGCGTSGSYVCTVYLPDLGDAVTARQMPLGQYSCAGILTRQNY